MGGYGSNRWGSYRRKWTVGECRRLDAGLFARRGYIRPGARAEITWGWWAGNDVNEPPTAQIGIEIKARETSGVCHLSYATTGGEHGGQVFNYVAPLVTTPCTAGGVQWWFKCPRCDRRVRFIYLPPGKVRFACRHCHNLTYRSAQEHDKTMDRYRRMNPARLMALLEGGDIRAARGIRDVIARERARLG